mmetsp:Transcript_12420/g.20867  ORF Transcript_12420/g.20867 Transcript_12420/m.20867 type:complete len:138 (-) Transcript_12420:72-485(-)
MTDYFESVREEAQQLLICISQRFLPPQTSLGQKELDLVMMLKTNIKEGWPTSMNSELKEAASLESSLLSYVFTDASKYVASTITYYMDEVQGRDNIIKFLKLLNEAAPFLIINDYRIAKQVNALRKAEILSTLLQQI